MSLTIRNADADRLVRLGDVLDVLHTFQLEIAQSLSDSTLLESSEWISGLVFDEVEHFAQNLLSELGV